MLLYCGEINIIYRGECVCGVGGIYVCVGCWGGCVCVGGCASVAVECKCLFACLHVYSGGVRCVVCMHLHTSHGCCIKHKTKSKKQTQATISMRRKKFVSGNFKTTFKNNLHFS